MGSLTARLSASSRRADTRHLLFVLGDQLDPQAKALRDLDPERDAVFMAEVREEAEHAPSHRQRTALFLSAMRHFALDQLDRGFFVRYVRLDDPANTQSFRTELTRAITDLQPSRVQVVRPGEHRVAAMIGSATEECGVPLDVIEDDHFTCSLETFNRWADDGRKELVLEYFYRERRRALKVLVDEDGKPAYGKWNFDKDNRKTFSDPPDIPSTYKAQPDAVTREVISLVERTWPTAPGRLDDFGWPVTRDDALRALRDFVDNRLDHFGTYEDAMWTGEPVLYHSRLASSLNLKLLRPQECVDAVLAALGTRKLSVNNIEGFIRQIIGWREFIRGVYYREGPGYTQRNELEHDGSLPEFFWTGDTDMNCLKQCITEVLDSGWGHHIQRLMVIGNFGLLAGVRPLDVHRWFLGMYVDAIDWVTAPNVIGMSQHADGGVVGTKPYVGGANYINRMSNYCKGCKYNPKKRTGSDACPFNTFYWDFLLRHRDRFTTNRRMTIALKGVERFSSQEKTAIQQQASNIRKRLAIHPPSS